MKKRSIILNIRFRYLIGLLAIAFLVTASFITMQQLVSKQRGFSSVISLAGHQAGLVNRIAYFASIMATTEDQTEFKTAHLQVGQTIQQVKSAHRILRYGSPEDNIPQIVNDKLLAMYEDPMVGLDLALMRFLDRAQQVYNSNMASLNTEYAPYVFLSTYGPHVLESKLDAAVEEYEKIGRKAIVNIERFEFFLWLIAIVTLSVELLLIYRPLEHRVEKTLTSLQSSITELTNTRKRLLDAQKLASVGDWELNVNSRSLSWSDQLYDICGISSSAFQIDIKTSLKLIHPEDRRAVISAFRKLSGNKPSGMEFRIIRSDGVERLVFQYVVAIKNPEDSICRISGIVQDITERKELSVRLEKLSQQIPGFIFQLQLNRDGNIRLPFASRGLADTCGIDPESMIEDAQPLLDLFHESDLNRIQKNIFKSSRKLTIWQGQYRIHHPDKGQVWLEVHATPERLIDGSTLWHGYIWDVTERKHSENQIQKLALYDALTGLANRRLLNDRLEHAISTSRRSRKYGGIIMLDLDNFKNLNDTKGHDIGDALLIEVGKRLKICLRECDTVARLGGDEFVLVLENLSKRKDIGQKYLAEIAEKIKNALNKTYILGDEHHIYHSSASLGVLLFNGEDKSASELLKRADVAMYEAKELGRNCVRFYSVKRQAEINKMSALAHDLKLALKNQEFSIYLQPQLSSSGRICGAEALLRWIPPGKNAVPPGKFIEIAEKTGLIIPLGEWVLEKTCTCLLDLKKQSLPDDFALAVNISARQFDDRDFTKKVETILSKTGIDTRRLKFELTESCLIHDMARGLSILTDLCRMGLCIELDDFGTGYSSLNSVSSLPLSALKIDRSLINGIEAEGSNKAILRAVIGMAKAMSLKTVAEGVETRKQRNFLVKEGCDVFQGYFYAKPMPYEDFINYLEMNHSGMHSA